jgi:hypothetical protein
LRHGDIVVVDGGDGHRFRLYAATRSNLIVRDYFVHGRRISPLFKPSLEAPPHLLDESVDGTAFREALLASALTDSR